MRQRLLLAVLGLVALSWVLFSSYDLLSNENLTDFRYYFNKADQTVYVVQDPRSLDWNNERITTTELNQSLYYSINKSIKEPVTLFFSAKKTKMLIEKKNNWTQKEVRKLFANGLFPLQMGGLKKFEFGKLHGFFNGNQLIIFEGELSSPRAYELNLSTKSSYSWFSWDQDQIKLTETYRKKEGFYRYTKISSRKTLLSKHDDKILFSEIVPDFFQSYAFYDKTYALQQDPYFAKTPWYRSVKTGFVCLKKDNVSLVIFDFKENANPIQTLNEFFHKEELNADVATFSNLSFSKLVSDEKADWHVAVLGQFGLASTDKSLLDQALGAASLGQTLSQNEHKLKRVFSNMPRKVSARWVDAQHKQTISLLGKQLVQTNYTKYGDQIVENSDNIRDYFVMNPGYRVLHFAAFDQRGNSIAYTENHQLVGYLNGLRKWEKPMEKEVFNIYQIKAFPELICVQLANEAQLYDKNGKLIYRLTHDAGTELQVIENKAKKEFVCVSGGTAVQLYNDKGTLIKQFAVGSVPKSIHCYVYNSRATVGVLTDTQMHFIDLAKRKNMTRVNVDSTFVLVGNNNAAFAVKAIKNKATVITSAGQQQFTIPNGVQCIGSYLKGKETMLIFKRNCSLFVYNLDGQRIWEKTIQANELTNLTSFKTANQRTILAFLDAVGNQVFLLDEHGRDLYQTKRHGQQAIQLSAFGANAYSLTTYLGNYLIQYNLQ